MIFWIFVKFGSILGCSERVFRVFEIFVDFRILATINRYWISGFVIFGILVKFGSILGSLSEFCQVLSAFFSSGILATIHRYSNFSFVIFVILVLRGSIFSHFFGFWLVFQIFAILDFWRLLIGIEFSVLWFLEFWWNLGQF